MFQFPIMQKNTGRKALSFIILSLLPVFLFYAPLFCHGRSLQTIEPLSMAGHEVLPALADLEDILAQRDRVASQSGLRIFGNIGLGNSTEPESAGSKYTVNYTQAYGRVGIALPILGSWARSAMAKLAADARLHESKQRLEAARASSLAGMRKAWIIRWVEYQKRRLIDQFLAEEGKVVSVLQKRMEQHLLLPVDYHEFLTSFDLARRNKAISLGLERQARTVIRLATGHDIPIEHIEIPDLPRTVSEERLRRFVMKDHPELLHLKDAAATIAQRKNKAGLSDIDARLEGFLGGTRDFPGTTGHNTTVQIVLETPLDIFSASKADRRTADAAVQKAVLNVKTRQELLLADLSAALYARDVAVANLSFARQRLASSEQGLQQAMLRLSKLSGDTFEKHFQACVLRLHARLDALSAIDQFMQAQTEVLRVAGGPPCIDSGVRESVMDIPHGAQILRWISAQPASSTPPSTPPRTISAVPEKNSLPWLGVYIWDASPLLKEDFLSMLTKLINEGFYRLLVSLTRQQIDSLQKDPTPFRNFVQMAHTAKCTVELVLAEPSWIEPQHRHDLIALLQQIQNSFHDIPLDGIHLDIEQDQLSQAQTQREQLAKGFIATVKAAVLQSRWPVRISIHPRYLDPQGPTPWMGKELKQSGVQEAVLMAYITNFKNLSALLERIRKADDALPLAVAQSIEECLPVQNSFFSQGKAALRTHLELLRKTPLPNDVTGGIVQSWEDYRRAPE